MLVGEAETEWYRYRYVRPDGSIVWRVEKRTVHPWLCHIHYGGEEAIAIHIAA